MSTETTFRTNRSHHLRRQAQHVHPIVAQAFRRRASEVELVAWLHQVTSPLATPSR